MENDQRLSFPEVIQINEALQDITAVLVGLSNECERLQQPLREEKASWEAELKVIEEAFEQLTTYATSKVRVFLRRADDARVDGLEEQAVAFEKEAAEAEQGKATLEKRKQGLYSAISVSDHQIFEAACAAEGTAMPKLKKNLKTIESAVIELRKNVVRALQGYYDTHGIHGDPEDDL
jgi:predicted  nucleic acid-binding Zn-ribbon protein